MFTILESTKLYRFLNDHKVAGCVVAKPITSLMPLAFSRDRAKGLKFVWLNDAITEIPDHCFENSDVEFVRISPATKRIGDCAFKNCKNLVSVKVPEGCNLGTKKSAGGWANSETVFEGCPKLRKKFQPWIDIAEAEYHSNIPAQPTIFFEGGFLTSTTDKKSWPNNYITDTGLLISPMSGAYYRVMDINTTPTPRFPDKYKVVTKIIQVK